MPLVGDGESSEWPQQHPKDGRATAPVDGKLSPPLWTFVGGSVVEQQHQQWPPGYGYPPAPQRSTNGLAIASMVLGIVWVYWVGSVLAVIFGHIALAQTKRNPYQSGRGMAIAGVVLGYIGLATLLAAILLFSVSFSASVHSG